MQTENLTKARDILIKNGHTLALFDGSEIITSDKRGVAPLLELLCEGKELASFSAADRVVGKGAAFLYVLLGIKELYTLVISEGAVRVLSRYKIPVTYEKSVPYIINRKGDGMCPIENAVTDIESPLDALPVIKAKVAELRAK